MLDQGQLSMVKHLCSVGREGISGTMSIILANLAQVLSVHLV